MESTATERWDLQGSSTRHLLAPGVARHCATSMLHVSNQDIAETFLAASLWLPDTSIFVTQMRSAPKP